LHHLVANHRDLIIGESNSVTSSPLPDDVAMSIDMANSSSSTISLLVGTSGVYRLGHHRR
jgi:hypothetical protein